MGSINKPLCILLFSGKRKAGKDFFTDKLMEMCNADDVVIIKISMPIKIHFSNMYNLSLKDMMGSGEFKENYRKEMIAWSEEMRKKDPGIFCKSAIDMSSAACKPIWIVSDVRRRTDIAWFKDNYGDTVKTVRIEADENVRRKRGWNFVPGIDDAESECDLDGYDQWDWIIENNDDECALNKFLHSINNYIREIGC